MCGRFALGLPRKTIQDRFGLAAIPEAPPRFNIAPGHLVEAVAWDDSLPGRRMTLLRWGLVPSWARDPSMGGRMINARAETVWDKPAFKAAVRRRRVLVPAQGFYEWSGGKGRRQAWFVAPKDGGLAALAGIREHYESPSGEVIDSLALLTCAANSLMAPIHQRMPVVIRPGDDARWLAPGDARLQDLEDLLLPREWPDMTAWRVGARVNAVSNEGPELIEPQPGPPLT